MVLLGNINYEELKIQFPGHIRRAVEIPGKGL